MTVDTVFGHPRDFAGLDVLAGVLLYSLQIYGDFAGYSNMARGIGRLLGIDLIVNFRSPYLAANIADFWRRASFCDVRPDSSNSYCS